MPQIITPNNFKQEGPCQCKKLQDLCGDDYYYCCDCDGYGGETKSNPTL